MHCIDSKFANLYSCLDSLQKPRNRFHPINVVVLLSLIYTNLIHVMLIPIEYTSFVTVERRKGDSSSSERSLEAKTG